MSLVKRAVVDKQAGQRLDSVLATWPEFPSRSAATHLIEAAQVTIDGQVVAKNYHVAPGDVICADLEADFQRRGSDLSIMPEPIPLDIRFEDDGLIILSKPAGLVVHPAQGNWTGTLVNALAWHFDELGQAQGAERPGIVHRLDKDTSGLMLAAKNDETQIALQEAIRQRTVDRRYLCLVHGWISQDTGLIDAPLARDARDPFKRAVSDHPSAKSAVTTFTVLERFEAGRFDDGYTLVECKLFTGRTHQIRVHMAYIGHPVVGDPLYGRRAVKANRGLERQFLHSYSLAFAHPVTGEELRFIDVPPGDLQDLLHELEPLSTGRTAEGEKIVSALASNENGSGGSVSSPPTTKEDTHGGQ